MLNDIYRLVRTANGSECTNRQLFLSVLVGGWLFSGSFFPVVADGHDWPMWRYDAGRCAASPEELPAEMHLLWARELPPPRPAWPRTQERLQFDASYEPIVAGKTLFVGSMVSDRVTAYDTETGVEKWRFYTDGPVRFAPVVYKDKLYCASDDGYLYCLNTEDGSLVRKFLGGPARNKVIGNDRLVGMWPMRGGPVLYAGKIYFAAGIWPFMGTFIHAIDAETGKIVWTNSGSGSTYLMQPHDSPAFAGVAPQGYLVATENKLLVSGGRSVPAAYGRHTGRFLYYHLAEYGKTGSCEVMASGDYFFNRGVIHNLPDGKRISSAPVSIIAGEAIIGTRNGTLMAYTLEPGAQKAKALWQTEIPSELSTIHLKAGSRLYSSGENGVIVAIDIPGDDDQAKISWRAKVDGDVWTMLAADGKLFVVTLQGRLYCFAEKKSEPRDHVLETTPPAVGSGPCKDRAKKILEMAEEGRGYCLLLGLGSGELLCQLLSQSKLHVVALDPDAGKVESIRRRLDEAGWYGTRAAVHLGDIAAMRLPPYMAGLIVSEDLKAAGFRRARTFVERLFHSLRPYGGTACLTVPQRQHIAFFRRAMKARLPGCEMTSSGEFVMVKRLGPLPDSGDWTHQYADSGNSVMSRDRRVKAPLGLLWFGGPPNDEILPRHGHGPSPHVVGGRLFIEGRNLLRAVDVYTGRLLWDARFQDLGEYYDNTSHQPGANEIGSNYVSLSDAVYVVYGDEIHVLDPATGKTAEKFPMPGEDRVRWGTLLVWEDLLLATASPVSVPLGDKKERTKLPDSMGAIINGYADRQSRADADPAPGRDVTPDLHSVAQQDKTHGLNKYDKHASLDRISGVAVNADYASSSRMLVVMDRRSGKVLWERDAEYSFRHNTIAVASGRVFCIDGMSAAKLAYLKRQGANFKTEPTLYALDARTGVPLWKTSEDVFGTWLSYSGEHDVLLEAGSRSGDRAKDEAGKGMIAYRGSDGQVLWSTGDSYKGPPILYHDWIITQTGGGSGSAPAEAKVFDLHTGEYVTRQHPMSGEMVPWTWVRFKGCNTAIASENLLAFRSASGAFVDLTKGQGTASIGGFKSGCTSNLIIANGVLNAPDYTRTCTCSYQNQASLALVHMPDVAYWTFDYYPSQSRATPVKRVGVNFGAPGNRYAEDGTLWLEFPSVGGPSPDIPIRAKCQDPRWFRYHSSRVKGKYNWIAASGVTGLKEVSIRMFIQPGEDLPEIDAFDRHIGRIHTWPEEQIKGAFGEPRPYTVRLYFAEVEDCEVGRRLFNVSLQGRRVLKKFDIAKAARGTNRCVVREFRGIAVKDDLRVTFAPRSGGDKGPMLNGIEIIAEDW